MVKMARVRRWIQNEYHNNAFTSSSFVGWKKFQESLIHKRPQQEKSIIAALASMRKPGRRHSLENPNNMAKARVSAAGAVQKKQRAYQRRSKKARAATSSCKQPSPESPILPHGFFNQNSELPNDFGSVLLFKSHPHNRPRYLTDGKLETESECVPKTDPAGANDMERIQQRDGIERKAPSIMTTSSSDKDSSDKIFKAQAFLCRPAPDKITDLNTGDVCASVATTMLGETEYGTLAEGFLKLKIENRLVADDDDSMIET